MTALSTARTMVTAALVVVAVVVPLQSAAAAPAPAGQCADSALRVRVHDDPTASGAGQRLAYVDFQNVGRGTCELRGAPGVSLVGHGDGTQLGRPADRDQAGTPPTVRVRPGESARADLGFTAVDEAGGAWGSTCRAVQADGYRIYPPHSEDAVFVRSPQYACTNTAIHWGGVGYLDSRTIGCATTSAGIPAGATVRRIADVDGDRRSDREWITATRFGITTASGATSAVRPDVAGGADPRALSVVLRGTTKAITLIAGSRDAQVFRFTGCRLRPVTNVQGDQYRFDLSGSYGDGVNCADPDGNGADQLIGLKLTPGSSDLKDGDTTTLAATDIGINGLHGVNGHARDTTLTWPQDAARIGAAMTITCRGATLADDGISAP